MQIYWLPIKEIIDETDEIKTYLLEWPEAFKAWQEGAHTHMALKGFDAKEIRDKTLIRHMSICTLPEEGMIGITTRIKKDRSFYKDELEKHQIGDKIALYRTLSNVPLRRENRPIYLLSAGVGLATFRPHLLQYFTDPTGVSHLYSLNIDSSNASLYQELFNSPRQPLTSFFVDNREEYYKNLSDLIDETGLYYIVGSDEFIQININHLLEEGISPEAIMIDKKKARRADFLPI